MIALKSVNQSHRCTEFVTLMDEFRHMVNEAIRVGIDKKITSKIKLRNELYHRFKNEFHTSYISMAVFKSHALLKSYRRALRTNPCAKKPYVSKNFLIIDSYIYKISHNHIKIPTRPREFVIMPLNDYVAKVLSEKGLKLGNITLTKNEISISLSKQVEKRIPAGFIGIDTNLKNSTCVDDIGKVSVIDMSKIVTMKIRYREVLSHFTRNDVRIQKKLKIKYGQKQKNKEDAFLHEESNKAVSSRKQIILENLNGMKKLYKKGNGQGRRFRFLLNSWSRFKLHKMMDYKSRWRNGFSVIYVNPKGTSSKCSICEAKVLEERRIVSCPRCGLYIDRDVNAARNILARGMQFVPDALASEAMVQKSALAENLKVDASELHFGTAKTAPELYI
ncbi:MAG: transposase [Thaumarchaeota archaeon]|nr:transposase [Nitrososphaerota archaeon]